jgi:serine/threonine protein kinase
MFERFEREVRLLQTLDHSSIVALVDVVFDPALIYLLLEYCPRGQLFSFVAENGRLSEYTARCLFR